MHTKAVSSEHLFKALKGKVNTQANLIQIRVAHTKPKTNDCTKFTGKVSKYKVKLRQQK